MELKAWMHVTERKFKMKAQDKLKSKMLVVLSASSLFTTPFTFADAQPNRGISNDRRAENRTEAPRGGNPGRGGGGGAPSRPDRGPSQPSRPDRRPSQPSRPDRGPSQPSRPDRGPSQPSRPDHGNSGRRYDSRPVHRDTRGNVTNPRYHERVNEASRRYDQRRNDVRVCNVVNRVSNHYRTNYRNYVVNNYNRHYQVRNLLRDRYRVYATHGFYGGFYWNFNAYYDIDTYFWNPTIYWFYSNDYDDYYYRNWYGNDYDTYRDLQRSFQYVGVFFPTEEFRDLNLAVSVMSARTQVNYRAAMVEMTNRLAQETSTRGGFGILQRDDVVVTHFQLLPEDNGIVVEGFVGQDRSQFAFKAFLDLDYPGSTMVFVPTVYSGGSYSDNDLYRLDQINDRIYDAGGEVEGQDDYSYTGGGYKP